MSRPREFDIDQVLRQSMEVFWTKGFKSTSYEDLTRTTQVKKQSLYCVFDDKRALFLKALALYRKQYLSRLAETVSQVDVSPAVKLDAIRESALCQGGEAARRGCLMVNSVLEFGTEDEEVHREVQLMFSEMEQQFETVIRCGQEQQLITARHSSSALAAHLSSAILGAKVMEKSGASREQIDAILRTTFALLAP